MSTRKLSNIPLKDVRTFLKKVGCRLDRTKGGHEHWVKDGLFRPLTLQTHKDPLPEFIIKNHLRTLRLSKKDFFRILEE